MRNLFFKHIILWRSLLFLLVLSLILSGLSNLSITLGRNINPLYDYSARDIFYEPKDSIDALVIGTSDVYSGVSPLEWWNRYGYAGYAWGEPAQRIFETHEYLKKIYQTQSPHVVFIEIGNLFRDQTDAQNLDSMVKAYIADVFPIVTYHRNFSPAKFVNLASKPQSLTKGYLLRTGRQGIAGNLDYMEPDPKSAAINPLSSGELKRCIDLCREHGSEVVLLAIPSYASWNMEDHNAVSALAEDDQVPFLDLNVALKDVINWHTDTADGGKHMNERGAQKISAFLGDYLHEHFTLPDHREDVSYEAWNADYHAYAKELGSILKTYTA